MDAAKSSSSTITSTKTVIQPTITHPTTSTTVIPPTTSDTIAHPTPSSTVNRPTPSLTVNRPNSSITIIQPSMSCCLSKEVKLRLCSQVSYLNNKLNDLHQKVTEMEEPAFRFGDLWRATGPLNQLRAYINKHHLKEFDFTYTLLLSKIGTKPPEISCSKQCSNLFVITDLIVYSSFRKTTADFLLDQLVVGDIVIENTPW